MSECDGRYKELKACSCHYEIKTTESERDRLKAELAKRTIVTSDEGTSYCLQCESYAKDRDLWRGMAEKLFKYSQWHDPGSVEEERELRATLEAFDAMSKGQPGMKDPGAE